MSSSSSNSSTKVYKKCNLVMMMAELALYYLTRLP